MISSTTFKSLSLEEKRALATTLLKRATRRLPASFAQQRLLFLQQFDAKSWHYNLPFTMQLRGPLQVSALERAIEEIVRRHEVLRTTFAFVDGNAEQVIGPMNGVTLPVLDLHPLAEAERGQEIRRVIHEQAHEPFDLERGPLLRMRLISSSPEEHIFVLTMHHIVSDAWSMEVFARELAVLYDALSLGQESPLAEPTIQYADYAVWHREWLKGDVLKEQLAYWKSRLAGAPILELPSCRPRPPELTYAGATYAFDVPQEVSRSLRELSRREGVTLFMTFLAAFNILLQRYSGQDDVMVGTPIAGRNRVETEGLIGFFLNTLVLRTDLSGNPSFRELLRRVKEVALGAYAHQDLPFEKLVEELQPQRDSSRTPLFQVMLVVQHSPQQKWELSGLQLTTGEVETGSAKFDLTLTVQEAEGAGLRGKFEYSTDLFDHAFIARMTGQFQRLLRGLAAHPEERIGALPLLTETERQQIVVEWNQTATNQGRNLCVQELFEEQVAKTPEAIALLFDGKRLTYSQLNERANQLARYLQRLGTGPETLVGICVEPSLEMVVGLLGILKAGGAYVPLDPSYPGERLRSIAEDGKLEVLLTQQKFMERLPSTVRAIVQLDADRERIARQSSTNLAVRVSGAYLAYIIYTSGSSGKPKGVAVCHCGVSNQLSWLMSEFGLSSHDRVLQRAPISFDASVGEIFAPLVTGAQLVIGKPDGTQDLDYLIHLMAKQKITLADLPPSLLTVMLDHPELTTCDHLKWIFCGGEVLPGELQQKFHQTLPAEMYNLYGPTETTIQSTFHKCAASTVLRSVPIGKPIANTQVYVLDPQMELVPAGVGGELYIGGAGLARGYRDRPDLTAERFVPDPLGQEAGARLYRTGDQVRWTADGNLEFLGRTDQQVKIRGFRIELGEIEAVLGAHSGVQSVLVLAREDQPGDKRLVAYVTERQGANVTTSDLRSYLKEKLPDYMVPAHIVILEQMPLTPNGKVDRRALPAPESGVAMGHEYTAPRTRTEELLAGIWAAVLRLHRVGIHDNFFELGGHSLLAMQVVSRIRDVFQAELSLSQLFKHATVASLAEQIGEKRENVQLTAIPRAIRKLARRQVDTGRCVPQLFEEQAERRPNSVAVVYEDRQLTYGELNGRANQLAHYLKSFGVGPNTLTGICVERSLEMVVALLGILKAGGAYLPMDANSLPERIQYMLEHAPVSVPVLVTQRPLAATLPEYRGNLVFPDSDWPKIAVHSEQNPVPTATLDDRAYVVYSSGSTSVLVRHSELLNRLLSMQEEHGMQSADCVLQQTPPILDAFAWEFFWPLIRGASVVVAQFDGQVKTRYLVDCIRRKGVTTVHLLSSQLECLLEEPDLESCVSLRRVICSGEPLDAEIVGRFHDKLEAELYTL